jgi:uncharacterized membrane protein (TIGR02234 family)
MTARRDRIAPAVAVLGTAAGGGLALFAAGRVWATATATPVAGTVQHLNATGRQAESGLAACAVACLALAVALLASSGWLRRLVALTAVMAAAATIATAVAAHNRVGSAVATRAFGVQATSVHPRVNGWWLVAVVGGLLALVAAGFGVAGPARARTLGSRYDAPQPAEKRQRRQASGPEATWDDIDSGHDPTAEPADS